MEPQARDGPAGDEFERLHGTRNLFFVDQRVYDHGLPVTREALHEFERAEEESSSRSAGAWGPSEACSSRAGGGSDPIVAAVRVAESHDEGPCRVCGKAGLL